MNGYQISRLLKRFSFSPLNSLELKILKDGLQALYEFNSDMGFDPEARYYMMEAESVQKIIDARNKK